MKLHDILQHLVSGELQGHSLKNGLVDGTLNQDHLKKVVSMINLGLLDLFTRFVLLQREAVIELEEHITTYVLDRKYATSNKKSTESYKYLHDSEFYPFKNDVIKILSIHNEMGQERLINDNNEYWSVHLINYNTIQHPYPSEENTLAVLYQARLEDIVIGDNFDPKEVEIDIPPFILRALLFFVASRVHVNISDAQLLQESNHYNGMYEAQLAIIKRDQMVRSYDHHSDNFDNNGFV